MTEFIFLGFPDVIFEEFGGIRLFRPSVEAEIEVRSEVETELRKKHASGKYTDASTINGILQDFYNLYDEMLKELLPQIASRHFMEFALAQYDKSCEIPSKSLSDQERERWAELGPVYRRAIKYLAECTVMLAPDEAPTASKEEMQRLMEKCFICAEELVRQSQLSSQTFVLFPDDTALEIRPEGELEWFVLTITDAAKYEGFRQRIDTDTAARKDVINEHKTLYDRGRLARVVDPVFKSEFGLTLTEVLSFVSKVINNTVQPSDGFDVPFVREQQLVDALVEHQSLSEAQAKIILDGLAIRQASMQTEGRVVWKPKQEYRAFFRPFFEFPHATGSHFTWSREMAKECFMMLFSRVTQKLLPREWNQGEIPKALGAYEQEITKLFEDIVIEQLRSQGIRASRFNSHIGLKTFKIAIPDDIGEIDLLAYWEEKQLLIVGDDKLVKPASEAALFRDDFDKFFNKKKNYVDQVKRKTQWVLDNVQDIATALESTKDFPEQVVIKQVAPILITYYPSFASYFVSELPIVALTELIAGIKATSAWPFSPIYKV
jgi:hypothetical protein